MMEEKGVVSGFDGDNPGKVLDNPRKVLIGRAEYERLFGDGLYLEDADNVESEEASSIAEEIRIKNEKRKSLEQKRDSLGIFKQKEKRRLQEDINKLNDEIAKLETGAISITRSLRV